MRRLRLTLEYDGSDFRGWQVQPEGRSVQGILEAALREITGEDVRLVGAGRTDAGVHALGQAAHCDSATRLAPLELRRALNAVLPADVAVRELVEAADGFHARRDARLKRYVYRILNRPTPSPLRQRFTWHLRERLDDGAMRAAAQALLGEHDFAAYRGAPGGAPPEQSTRRRLDRLDARREADELHLVAEGPAFLRHMVRNLVGTLVEVGQGRRPVEAPAAVLASGQRARAGATAPAQGLCLERVEY